MLPLYAIHFVTRLTGWQESKYNTLLKNKQNYLLSFLKKGLAGKVLLLYCFKLHVFDYIDYVQNKSSQMLYVLPVGTYAYLSMCNKTTKISSWYCIIFYACIPPVVLGNKSPHRNIHLRYQEWQVSDFIFKKVIGDLRVVPWITETIDDICGPGWRTFIFSVLPVWSSHVSYV